MKIIAISCCGNESLVIFDPTKRTKTTKMKKTITIHQVPEDSIDEPVNTITIDVWYTEGTQSNSQEPNTPDEIDSIEYEGLEVSDFIGTMFTDEQLLNAQSDLETDKSLDNIKMMVAD